MYINTAGQDAGASAVGKIDSDSLQCKNAPWPVGIFSLAHTVL